MTATAPSRAGATTVGLVGRANSGKTSVAMHLTGVARRPVNFPGSSVECVESYARWSGRDFVFVDLPGIASLSAGTRDEAEAVGFLEGRAARGVPDLLCVVVDASKLSVELRLVRDVAKLGRPLVVALNKTDVARRDGVEIDAGALSEAVGAPVVATDGLRGQGLVELRSAIVAAGEEPARADFDPEELAARVSREVPRARWNLTDALDAVVLHEVLALPVLALVMFATFHVVFTVADPFVGWIEAGQEALAGVVEGVVAAGWLQSLLVDGVINGVGSVFVFLPQIALMMAFVTVLEASGYMARAAYVLDRVLGRVGLSGRSFVPLVSSFACAIPGIMAARIIDDERDRLATVLVAPLMSCSARLPVYVVLIGAFFPAEWGGAVLLGMYALGIVVAAAVAFTLRGTLLRGGQSMLVMELPVYQRPSLRVVGRTVLQSCRSFVVLAGTVIFATAVVIWALSYFPRPEDIGARFDAQRIAAGADAAKLAEVDAAEDRAYLEQSYLARAGKAVQPVFAPAGFDWRTTVGVLAAFPARELVVPTLGILHSVPDVDPGAHDLASLGGTPPDGLRARLRTARDESGDRAFTPLIALALMVFFALCSQCMATLGVIAREAGSWKWAVFAFGYMTALAWVGAVVVYQGGSLLGFE